MHQPHQSEPVKLIRMAFPSRAACSFAAGRSVVQVAASPRLAANAIKSRGARFPKRFISMFFSCGITASGKTSTCLEICLSARGQGEFSILLFALDGNQHRLLPDLYTTHSNLP